MMASGEMTRMLVHTDVTRYLEFKQIAGSFVYRDGRISKVPSTEMEAVRSPLMGLFEKRRAKKFFEWVQGYKEDDPATYQGAFWSCRLGRRWELTSRAQECTWTERPCRRSTPSLDSSSAPKTLSATPWLSTSTTRAFQLSSTPPCSS